MTLRMNRMRMSAIACGMLALAGCNAIQLPTHDAEPNTQTIDKFELWNSGANLRGANIYQRRVYAALDGTDFLGPGPVGPPFVQADFDALAALGANYVNISHPGIFSESPPYQLDPAVLQNLDDLIAKAAAAHLFVVISIRTGPGRSEFAIFEGQTWFPQSLVNNEIWTSAAAQDGWVAMWQALAEHFQNNPVVVGFDLMVEPNGPSTIHNEWNPAIFDLQWGGTLSDWNQLHPRLSAAIRAIDGDTPILTSASAYGSIDWLGHLKPTADDRTVYTVHFYNPNEYTNQEPDAGINYPGDMAVDGVKQRVDRDWLDQQLAALDTFRRLHGVPIAMNEFGVKRWCPDAAGYFTDLASLLEARGVNSALWLWESSYPGLATVDDFNLRHGPDAANHAEVAGSDLLDAIRTDWGLNSSRP